MGLVHWFTLNSVLVMLPEGLEKLKPLPHNWAEMKGFGSGAATEVGARS
jgi:hypothetical protein